MSHPTVLSFYKPEIKDRSLFKRNALAIVVFVRVSLTRPFLADSQCGASELTFEILFFWINVCFWETTHLLLPKPNILPKVRSKC